VLPLGGVGCAGAWSRITVASCSIAAPPRPCASAIACSRSSVARSLSPGLHGRAASQRGRGVCGEEELCGASFNLEAIAPCAIVDRRAIRSPPSTSLVGRSAQHGPSAVVRMSALLDGRAGVCEIAPVLPYVGLAIVCVNLLAVVLIARLGRRLSGTSHEVLPPAAGRVVSLTRASQRARARPAGPRQSRRRAARGRAL
jgi:hypothetical protein